MANIPVQKKSGFPWWGWVLVLIAVALVVWWFFGMAEEEEVDVQSATPTLDGTALVASNTVANGVGNIYVLAPDTAIAR